MTYGVMPSMANASPTDVAGSPGGTVAGGSCTARRTFSTDERPAKDRAATVAVAANAPAAPAQPKNTRREALPSPGRSVCRGLVAGGTVGDRVAGSSDAQ